MSAASSQKNITQINIKRSQPKTLEEKLMFIKKIK